MMKLNKLIILSILIGALFADDIKALKVDKSTSHENEKLYRRAKSLEGTGLLNEAEQIYHQIFMSNPGNEKYYNSLKKILIRHNDCITLIDNADIFCEAKNNEKYSKINKLEVLIICNADWEDLFYNLLHENLTDTRFLTRMISKLINNEQEKIAIESVKQVRNLNQDISFFANELGYYYISSKKYSESLIEFLNHLEKFPKHLKMINERIMSFPNEKNINDGMIKILEESPIIESKIILADLYFKIEDYLKSIEVLKKNNFLKELLSLAINLNELEQFEIAHDVFIYIIQAEDNKVAQEAIFELAKSLEKRGLSEKSILPISNFMAKNDYFSSPFIRINQEESDLMYKAIDLYDSLSIKNNNLNSNFRLSEIRFRALGDLDTSYDIYMNIYKSTRNKDLKLKTIKRIADVLLAKGDLKSAMKIIDNELASSIWNDDEKIQIRVKQNQILFYESELDFILDDLTLISKEYSVEEVDYNDILEIVSILTLFKDHEDIFKKFTQAQLKIHQNKRAEAIIILDLITRTSENVLLNNLINYQIANLLVSQNKPNEAIEKLQTIIGEDIYKELGQILIAEIYDHILYDFSSAKIYYLSILQNFPTSIHYEQIRLRLKEIMSAPS